jgi:hypothetical protein
MTMDGFLPFTYTAPARSAPSTAVLNRQAATVDEPPAKPEPGGFDFQSLLSDFVMFAGAAAFTIGVGLLSVPGGFLTGGVVMVFMALVNTEEE